MSRSEMMSAVRSKGTKPEMLVRRFVHSLGYRYRLHKATLPGKPDLVFALRKKVIFIHGCFWHQHGCNNSHLPKTNIDYWKPKLEKNKDRDIANVTALESAGWSCLELWECELNDFDTVKERIVDFLGSPQFLA